MEICVSIVPYPTTLTFLMSLNSLSFLAPVIPVNQGLYLSSQVIFPSPLIRKTLQGRQIGADRELCLGLGDNILRPDAGSDLFKDQTEAIG
jgi:hypothetical protein